MTPDEKKDEAVRKVQEEQPAWEGSLSDVETPPAPDGHDIHTNALEEKGKK